jgi:hypothetical protein
MKARATYTVKKWEEATYHQISPDMKMTKASVEFAFTGDMEGKGSVEYLMFYRHVDEKDPHKSAASYVGLIRFEGTVAGKSGSFVMEDRGSFESGTARSDLRIAADSGTGALAGIMGTGTYRANQDGFHLDLEYNLP